MIYDLMIYGLMIYGLITLRTMDYRFSMMSASE